MFNCLLVDLNYNFECEWLIELSNNKLSYNNLAGVFQPITIKEIVIFMIVEVMIATLTKLVSKVKDDRSLYGLHNVSNHICYHFIINLPAKELHVCKHVTFLTLEHPRVSSRIESSLCDDCFLLFQANQPKNTITIIHNPRRQNNVMCRLSKDFSIRLILLDNEEFICLSLPFSKELSDSTVQLQSHPLDVTFFFGRSLHGFDDLRQCF